MAFQLPSLPNFQTNIPQMPNALDQATKAAQLKNMLSENSLRQSLAPLQVQEQQQRVQAGDIENQMKTMQLQGQRALADWLQNGDANEEVPTEKFSSNDKIATYVGVSPNDPIMSVVRSMAQHHVPAPMLMTEAQGMLQRRNEYFKGTKEEQDAQANERKIWQTTLAEIHEADPDQRSVLLSQKLPLLQENSKTDPLLGAYAKGLAGHPELIDQAYNVVSAENAALGLRKAKAEATTAEQKVIPTGGGMSPEAQQKVQQDIAVATNPQIQAGKVAVAEAEGRAKANIEHEFAVRNNAALATVPTHLVAPATAAAEKANKEYADAKSVSDRMNATMDAAKKGNVVSYQIIPQEGTLQLTTSQGVHRINKTEIDQYAGGGDLWQRLEGHIGKQLTGKSIPDSVLKDMAEIQNIQAEGSRSRYENTLTSINQTYGSKFQPVEMQDLNRGRMQHTPGGKATGLTEGQTGTGSDGKPYVVKDGVWVLATKTK